MEFSHSELASKINITRSIVTQTEAGSFVAAYAIFAKTTTADTVHVHLHASITFESMVYIYAAVKSIKDVHAHIKTLVIHVNDNKTAASCNRLFKIFTPSILVNVIAE